MSLPAFLLLTDTAENRTLCRVRALSKREAFVASGRGRRQAAEAGAGSRSEHADSPRKASTRYGCDVIESQPAIRRINGTPNPRRIELYAGRGRKESAAATQGGMRFPGGNSCSGVGLTAPPSTPKPMRSLSQNWVEESQNAIAGGQYDCRR